MFVGEWRADISFHGRETIIESKYNEEDWFRSKANDFYCPGNAFYFDSYGGINDCRIEDFLLLYLHVYAFISFN